MKKGPKIIHEEVTTTMDNNGVIKQHFEKKVHSFPKEPPYVKLYIADLSYLLNVSKSGSSLLGELVKQINYEGIVTITKGTRERMGRHIGCSEKTIMNNITFLIDKGVMKRIGHCEYEMNPNYFAKGDWYDIRKRREAFQLKIDYLGDKRIIKGEVIEKSKVDIDTVPRGT